MKMHRFVLFLKMVQLYMKSKIQNLLKVLFRFLPNSYNRRFDFLFTNTLFKIEFMQQIFYYYYQEETVIILRTKVFKHPNIIVSSFISDNNSQFNLFSLILNLHNHEELNIFFNGIFFFLNHGVNSFMKLIYSTFFLIRHWSGRRFKYNGNDQMSIY